MRAGAEGRPLLLGKGYLVGIGEAGRGVGRWPVRAHAVHHDVACTGQDLRAVLRDARAYDVAVDLERNGLLGYVDRIFTNTEVGSSKNDPEIFDLAAKHMGTLPGETLVFEDSLYALKTAKAAGYHTVGVYDAIGEPDQEGLKAEADIYVQAPGEFLKISDIKE